MVGGYAGKFLEVDLTGGGVTETCFSEDVLRRYVGGRGLASWILWDRLGARWDRVDPLGSENLFLVLSGPLTGYFHGARICVTGKSPQNNGIIGSTVSGEFPVELKCAGWDGVIVSGKAEEPVYILIDDDRVELKDAGHLWSKDGKETLRLLTGEVKAELDRRHARFGVQKEPAVLYIGPAGENRVRVASVIQKWTHAAGYGGYGAVMGSKNLKALVVKGSGPLPLVADFEEVRGLMAETEKVALASDRRRRWGTGYSGYEVEDLIYTFGVYS